MEATELHPELNHQTARQLARVNPALTVLRDVEGPWGWAIVDRDYLRLDPLHYLSSR